MTAGTPLRLYLVDDHEVVRHGIRHLLEDEGDMEVIGEADCAADALAQIPELRPDVVLLDNRLPDGSGIDVCRDIRSADPQIGVLILTSHDDDDALFSAIMAGASGYVLKQVRSVDLVDSVRQVATGRSLLDPTVTAQVLERIRAASPKPSAIAQLTSKEREVLDLIGQGFSNRQIAAELSLAEKTVKNYVSSVLSKLGVESRTQAALLLARSGHA
ncbi:response regulator transcription factor [Nocardioides sp.]|uniref:response regulator n=1 Tax=Nocardioides sp. TaxID=35761 RepID=UPI00261068FD|nr:response regulator transcription factor [Nocardioides sp.]